MDGYKGLKQDTPATSSRAGSKRIVWTIARACPHARATDNALVLDSASSPITKRVYNMALNEFLAWFQQSRRNGFTKATVSAWRVSLEDRCLRRPFALAAEPFCVIGTIFR